MGNESKTDISTILGIVAAFTLIGIAISMGGGLSAFVDTKSFLIVIGGTTFLTVACFTFKDFVKSVSLVFKTIFYTTEKSKEAAIVALQLSEEARKLGILSLQDHQDMLVHNKFLKRGINFVVDGLPHEEIEKIMKEEIYSMLERHQKGIDILRKAAEIAPAMGLIGTLIGLIQMLGGLDDPSSIGPSMAVALLTTLYGAVLSYMVLTPLAAKLEKTSKEEADIMDIYLLAIGSIGRKENPRRLEMLINSILSPANRVEYF